MYLYVNFVGRESKLESNKGEGRKIKKKGNRKVEKQTERINYKNPRRK